MDASLIWSLLRVVVVLLIIIPASIYATRWYAKKHTPDGNLKLKEALSLGTNKTIYVIEWDGKQFLVGVTNQTITLLDHKTCDGSTSLKEVPE